MRWYIGRHTDSNTLCTVYEQVRIPAWKNGRFLLCLIKVWSEINGIFVDISKQLHGNFAQSCLCISHGSRAVTIDRTEIAMSVYERITCRPILRHIDQCAIDGAVTMRVIFTHCITDNTRTLSVWLVRTIVQLDHGEKYTPLHRL